LPLFYLPLLPAILINFLERFVSNEGSRWTLGMHYNAPLTVLLFISTTYIISSIEKSKKYIANILAIIMIINTILLHRFILRGPLALVYNPVFYEQNDRVEYVDNLVRQIPSTGSVMTTNDLA